MRALVIGGTRNLGPDIVKCLLEEGYEVTVFNRGITPDELPGSVERLRGDRRDAVQLGAALGRREFDFVIDTAIYTGAEAQAVVQVLMGRVGHYIFLSTGQVYLVRAGLQRPFKEDDYQGQLISEPAHSEVTDYNNWRYGFDKREAEDVFARVWEETRFPYTSLRLPMVHSERDHYHRLQNYIARIQDGGPILIPHDQELPVRHVYGQDVVQAIKRAAHSNTARGRAFNIGQDETLSLDQFLRALAGFLNRPLRTMRVPREQLEQNNLLPDCSPFSGKWMSSLDNSLSKTALGMRYTPVEIYLERLVSHFSRRSAQDVPGYESREKELALATASLHD